jgi:hypothetical protein
MHRFAFFQDNNNISLQEVNNICPFLQEMGVGKEAKV